jgi:mannosyl-3-phosphoglycerate synthase
VAEKGVEILQTETINPHLHKEKGEEHLLKEMLLPSLSVIYHSPLTEDTTRQSIVEQLKEQGCITGDHVVPQVSLMPPPAKVDMEKFRAALEEHLPLYSTPSGVILTSKVPGFELPPKPERPARVIFTDLDGTLLHPVSYSYVGALDALRLIQEKGIPLVFCSAKTQSEQESYRQELDVHAPFIVENGGAIYIPRDYFRFPFAYDREFGDYLVIELGLHFKEVRLRLDKARADSGLELTGFADMTVEEVALKTGLSLKAAEMARQREYTETLVLPDDKHQIQKALDALKAAGLEYVFGGRFYEVMVGNDKGKAVKILTELFKLNYGEVITTGIGDSENDQPMLGVVNEPYLVLKANNRWASIRLPHLHKIRAVGPEGWSQVVRKVAEQLKPA